MHVLKGPQYISNETVKSIVSDLEALNHGQWIDVYAELQDDAESLLLRITVDRNVEGEIVESALIAMEQTMLPRMGITVPIRDDDEPWRGVVVAKGTVGDIIDGTEGGYKQPGQRYARDPYGSEEEIASRQYRSYYKH